MFFDENEKLLAEYARVSRTVGARADYVQGGGGNTSVKLPGGLMAIKASGFCLKDIRPDGAYAVLDYEALRRFYFGSEPADLPDVEKAGSEQTRAALKTVEGLKPLRPSVEAGFHSLLRTFVVHTHSVYANLAACSDACREIAAKAFAGADYTWGWVPYTDPGANLSFAIRDELRRVETETGRVPSVILMQNHGVIVHDDDPDRCLYLQADANRRLAAQFGLMSNAFPAVRVKELAGGIWAADCAYLRESLRNCVYPYRSFLKQPIYPDQLVFLVGTFFLDKDGVEAGECVASTKTGEVLMRMSEGKAQTMAETLTAVFFVREHIMAAGRECVTLGESAKSFIANWESEKYRKTLAGAK